MSASKPDASAADRLLHRPAPEGYLAEMTARYARAKEVAQRKTESVLVFRLGVEWLAVRTALVGEILPLPSIHTLPHRRQGVLLGVANVGGQLVVCVALDRLIGVAPVASASSPAPGGAGRLLVIEQDDGRVALPVTHLHGVHRYHPNDVREAPSRNASAFVRSVVAVDTFVAGILDPDRLHHALGTALA